MRTYNKNYQLNKLYSSQDYSLQQSELWNIAKLSQYQQEKITKMIGLLQT